MGFGVRMPATTSSPCALSRYSPYTAFSPVAGLRVKATPVPEVGPRFPNTMVCTLTAVPRSWGILLKLREVMARGLFHDSNTAWMAISSCCQGSSGNAWPARSRTGPDGHQQRLGSIAEPLAGPFFQQLHLLPDLIHQAGRKLPGAAVVLQTGLGGDGESGRHRESDAAHLRQAGAFAAQQVTHRRIAFFKQHRPPAAPCTVWCRAAPRLASGTGPARRIGFGTRAPGARWDRASGCPGIPHLSHCLTSSWIEMLAISERPVPSS